MLCVAKDQLKRSRIHGFVQILRHFRLSRPDDTSSRASYTPILFPSRWRLFLPVEFCNALVLTSAGRLTAVHLIDASEGCLPAGELGYWSHRLRQHAPSEKAPVKIPVVTMLLMFMDTPTFFFESSDHQSFPSGSAPRPDRQKGRQHSLPVVASFNRAQVRCRSCPDGGVELAQHRRMLT